MTQTGNIQIHFFVKDEKFAVRVVRNAPRVGDEVRFSDERYFKVNRLVWAYDEENRHERVNIELVNVDD